MDAQSNASLNVIDLLTSEHHALARRIGEFLSLRPDRRDPQMLNALCAALKIHMMGEAEIFYPKFLHATHDGLTYLCASINHESLKMAVGDIEGAQPGGPEFAAQVRELYMLFAHHASDAEKPGGLFEVARHSVLDGEAVGRAILNRKRELEEA